MRSSSLILVSVVVASAWAAACSSAEGGGDLPLATDAGGDSGGTEISIPEDTAPAGPADDFPSAPIIDAPSGGLPAPKSAPSLFGAAGTTTGGPCVAEPQVGSLFPRNFLRPRFRFNAPAGHNLFEIRLHTDAEKNDLVVYTTSTTWILPAEMWNGLSAHAIDKPITMTVRSGKYDSTSDKLTEGPFTGTSGAFTIAPAEASGTIVYWMLPSSAGATSCLKGFTVGDETVKDVLDPSKISGSQCIGCHTSTPDGKAVAMSSSSTPSDGSGPAWVEIRSLADLSTPSFITAQAKSLLERKDQHALAFTKAHWATGDHLMLSGLPVGAGGKREIVWTNLDATSTDKGVGWDILTRTGDANAAGGAAWSHDGKNVAYFSAPAIGAGLIDGAGQSDLFVVPFNDKKGGTATAVYKDPTYSSFYPQFSADDALLAFTRVPRGETSYNNAKAEIMVVPAAGGSPTRLVANDPNSCVGGTSPGLTNSWPKWSPVATVSGGKTYYWLTFSSTRGAGSPQLYVAPIVVSGGTVITYPALYLWNQPASEHNHTPAWDVFALSVK